METIDISKIPTKYIEYLKELGFWEVEVIESVEKNYPISKLANILHEGCLSTTLRESYCNLLNVRRACVPVQQVMQPGRVAMIIKVVDEDKNEYITVETTSGNQMDRYYFVKHSETEFNQALEDARKKMKLVMSMAGDV